MATHVASAAIRRLQTGSDRHQAREREPISPALGSGVATEPSPRSEAEDRSGFAPVISSTPAKRERVRGPRSLSASSSDTEKTSSPSQCGELTVSSPDRETSGSTDEPLYRAPITGYEILEHRAKFAVFKIHVQNVLARSSWYVFRRYTDFVRLNRKLRGLFPMTRLPLPPKRWFKDNFSPSFLEERISGLQQFVNTLLAHTEMCRSHHVRDFFCLDDPPGPHDSLEESRLRCETLEDLVCTLQMELREKRTEIDVLKEELSLTKSQKETLVKSLRRLECSIVNDSEPEFLATLTPQVQRLHHVNVTLATMMESPMVVVVANSDEGCTASIDASQERNHNLIVGRLDSPSCVLIDRQSPGLSRSGATGEPEVNGNDHPKPVSASTATSRHPCAVGEEAVVLDESSYSVVGGVAAVAITDDNGNRTFDKLELCDMVQQQQQ